MQVRDEGEEGKVDGGSAIMGIQRYGTCRYKQFFQRKRSNRPHSSSATPSSVFKYSSWGMQRNCFRGAQSSVQAARDNSSGRRSDAANRVADFRLRENHADRAQRRRSYTSA